MNNILRRASRLFQRVKNRSSSMSEMDEGGGNGEGNNPSDTLGDSDEDQWEYYDDNTTLTDFWQALAGDGVYAERNPYYDPLDLWLRDIDLGENADKERENVFREYWRIQIPRILSPTNGRNSINQVWDEAYIKSSLIDPLDAFICGTTGGYELVYENLAAKDAGQSVMCGHVFAPEEACYSCRECGEDHTCVMCSECFQNSEHQNHKYKMYTSDGGGYCDCGDEEAFTSHHVCNLHKEKISNSESLPNDDPLLSLPLDMQVRTKRLFIEILRYIFEVTSPKRKHDEFIVGGKEKEVWPELKHAYEFANKCLVLINDNFHQYGEVTKVVKKSLSCNQKMAHDVTEFVDKEGRAIVCVGKHADCFPIRDKIEATSRRDGRSLKCEIISTFVVAHQNFAVRLLSWLYEILKRHSGFRNIFVNIALGKDCPDFKIQMAHFPLLKDLTLCEAILLNDAKLWKRVRKAWFNVVIEGIMKDYDAKKTLAQNYIKHYKTIMSDFVSDDQETDISITNISVQIFTVPTIAHNLVEFHNAFHVMAEYFIYELNEQKGDSGQLMLEQWMEEEHSEFNRVHHVLLDMQYLLSKAPTITDTWSEKMRQSFLEGAQTFLKILWSYQGIDPHRRETLQHIEFESQEWESVYKLTEPTWQIAEEVMEWCKTDKVLFIKVLEKAVELAMEDFDRRFSKYETIESSVDLEEADAHGTVKTNTKNYEMIDMEVGREPVSANIPLQRFLGGLIPCIEDLALTRSTDRILGAAENFCQLTDPVASTLTMLSQAACHLWRRNGHAIDGISFIYHQFLPRLKQNDLVMLQLAVALSNDFGGCIIQTLIHRFRLIKWANGEFDELCEFSDDEVTKTLNIADEFLKIVLAILSERFTFNVGKVSKKDDIRYHVIHMLCTGPLSHSEITTLMRHKIRESKELEKDLEEVIKEIGTLAPSKKDPSKRVFELKEEYRHLYNPFYYYYTREQSSAAITVQAEKLKSADNKKSNCLVPPNMPTLATVFNNLPQVTASYPLLKVIDTTLKKFIPTNPKFFGSKSDAEKLKMQESSHKHLHKVLFIILIGCEDNLNNESSVEPCFLKAAQKLKLVDKLSGIQFLCLSADVEDLKELLSYTISKLKQASNKVLEITNENEGATSPKTSKSSDGVSTGADSSDSDARKRRAEAAATHRAKVMAQMNKAQNQFMEKNVVEIMDTDTPSNTCETTEKPQTLEKNVALGKLKSKPHYENHLVTCILCQEEQWAWSEENKGVLVMASYVTKSTVFSQFDISKDKDSNSYCSKNQIPSKFGCCPSVSSCGHFMHAKCYQKFFDSLVTKARDNLFRQILNYDVDRQEYLCPICERLCNNILPVLPPVTKYLQCKSDPNSDLEKWIKTTKTILSEKYLDEPNGGASSAFPNLIEDIVRLVLKKPALALKDAPSFPKLTEQLRNMSTAFANNTYSKSLSSFPSEEDARMVHLNLQSLIVSLHLSQCGADDTMDQIYLEMNSRDMDTLRSLTRLCLMIPFSFFQKASNPLMKCLRSNAIYILSVLLKNDVQDKTFNDFDAFGVLVFCVASYPALTFPDREATFALGKEDGNMLLLCLLVNLVQIMVNYPDLEKAKIEKFGPLAREDKSIKQLLQKITNSLGIEYITKTQHTESIQIRSTTDNLSNILKRKMLRFLRCSALFFHFSTDIPLPEVSLKSGNINNLQSTYESLTTYLGVPNTIAGLLETPGATQIIDSLLASNVTKSFVPMELPAPRRRLIDLPDNYLSLLSKADQYRCPNSVTKDSKSPALCLVCGTIVCSQSPCCELQLDRFKAGGCTVHSRRCGGDNGIFLRLRKCQIILLSDVKRGVLLPAPYVDEYGECDEGLKRGNPLKLDKSMYEELNKIWLNNDIPDKISRHFDTEVVTISARWYEL